MEKRKFRDSIDSPPPPNSKKQRSVSQWEKAKILAEHYCVELKPNSTLEMLITLLCKVVPQDFFVERLGVVLNSSDEILDYVKRQEIINQWFEFKRIVSREGRHELLCKEMSLFFGFVVAEENVQEIESLFENIPPEVIVIVGEQMDLKTLEVASRVSSVWRSLLEPVFRRRTFALMRRSLLKRFLFHTALIGERWKLVLIKRENVTFGPYGGELVQDLKWLNQTEPDFEAMFQLDFVENMYSNQNNVTTTISCRTGKNADPLVASHLRRPYINIETFEDRWIAKTATEMTTGLNHYVLLKNIALQFRLSEVDSWLGSILYDFIDTARRFEKSHALLLMSDQFVQNNDNIQRFKSYVDLDGLNPYTNATTMPKIEAFLQTCSDSLQLTRELRYFSTITGPKFDSIDQLKVSKHEKGFIMENLTRFNQDDLANAIQFKCGDAFLLFLDDPQEILVKVASTPSITPPPLNYCLREVDDNVLHSSRFTILTRFLFIGEHYPESPLNVVWKHFRARE